MAHVLHDFNIPLGYISIQLIQYKMMRKVKDAPDSRQFQTLVQSNSAQENICPLNDSHGQRANDEHNEAFSS